MQASRRGFLGFLGLLATGAQAEAPVVVFAAASLKTVLDKILEGRGAVASYTGSGALARQILQGAPADIFISAHGQWMDVVEEAGLVAGRRVDLASNRLVIVGPRGSVPLALANLPERLGDGRLAIGQTRAVPAGIYGRAALERLGLWPGLARRLAETDSVRTALALVARGEVPFGLVYATDALAEPAVDVVAEIPADSHPPIRYPAALLSERGEALFQYLFGPEAAAMLEAAGFQPVPRA